MRFLNKHKSWILPLGVGCIIGLLGRLIDVRITYVGCVVLGIIGTFFFAKAIVLSRRRNRVAKKTGN